MKQEIRERIIAQYEHGFDILDIAHLTRRPVAEVSAVVKDHLRRKTRAATREVTRLEFIQPPSLFD
ncbi:hypothetical protein [Bifidobacterium platyrrhinorum]|uniref:Uncharacterized protein n=1 Tax=Bifidobacterium platyrrhinorum TaxID=2661628 RepID=A0A6L9SUC4_9BIFI|nr:hypothetical protein [Bifidobacterium platyrrhinorum]NEG56148.1 hypothetical protein [Bifidobacterium platyrrhinorum]